MQTQIECFDDQQDDEERENFETSYFELHDRVQNFIDSHTCNGNRVEGENISHNFPVKLPPINLPDFVVFLMNTRRFLALSSR